MSATRILFESRDIAVGHSSDRRGKLNVTAFANALGWRDVQAMFDVGPASVCVGLTIDQAEQIGSALLAAADHLRRTSDSELVDRPDLEGGSR